jgi:F0F1-type ATP synthase assembly protein I
MDDKKITPDMKRQRGLVAQAVGFAWDFGVIVVLPLVVLAILGRYLDRRYGTEPWIFLGGVIVSIVMTTILVVMKLSRIVKDISTTANETKHTDK